MAGALGNQRLRTLPTSRQGRWVAPFGLGVAVSVGEARRLVRLAIRQIPGRSEEAVRVRQLLRAELDLLCEQPVEGPLTKEQAFDLSVLGSEAEQLH